MNSLSIFIGVTKYEFRMQIRRKAMWITFLCLTFLSSILGGPGAIFRLLMNNPFHLTLLQLVAFWTSQVNSFMPIIFGIMLADRLSRDRRTKVDELFLSTPGALNVRLAGKYVGSVVATVIPILLYDSIGIGFILYNTQNPLILLYALETFAAIAIPGLLFVAAFSIACPAIMWVPLYQFLFVGYWFWGNLLGAANGIPTLSNTILTPVGGYMDTGFFGDPLGQKSATVLQGVESIVLLLAITFLVLFVLWSLLKWQQARQ
jgi:ABC-2 type transport system permease protein